MAPGTPSIGNAQPANNVRLIVYPADQRPIKVIDFTSTEIGNGIRTEWGEIATSYEWLTGEIDNAISKGYLRIFFNMPAGNPAGNTRAPASIWETLDENQLNLLNNELGDFIRAKVTAGITFGIIAGFYIDNVTSMDVENPRLMAFDKREDVTFMKRNWTDWLSIGIRTFVGMDADESEALAPLLRLANVFWSRGVRVYGKDVPINSTNNGIDWVRLFRVGWMCPWSQIRTLEATGGQLSILGANAETIVELHPNNARPGEGAVAFSQNDALSLMQRGFTVASWENSSGGDQAVMQAYQIFTTPIALPNSGSSGEGGGEDDI